MIYSLYELTLIFFFYAFLGWCLEVARFAIHERKFINRGFLNGPYCPIYGFGVVGVLLLLNPLKSNWFLLFICSIILTSVLEFAVGFLLEKLFHQKWWDYSKDRFNIKGYICLYASVVWGAACTIVVYFLQPLIDKAASYFPENLGVTVAFAMLMIITADTIVALVSILKIRHKFVILGEISHEMDNLSKLIGQNIADNAISFKDFNDKNRQDLEDLKANYRAVFNKKVIGYNRIFEAFPSLRVVRSRAANDKERDNNKNKQ